MMIHNNCTPYNYRDKETRAKREVKELEEEHKKDKE